MDPNTEPKNEQHPYDTGRVIQPQPSSAYGPGWPEPTRPATTWSSAPSPQQTYPQPVDTSYDAQVPSQGRPSQAPPAPLSQYQDIPSNRNSSKLSVSRLLILITVILILLGGLGVGGWLAYKHYFAPKPAPVPKKVVPAALPATQLCSQVGTAIVCQDLTTGTTLKYATPSFVGPAYAILSSPDDTKVFIDSPANTLKEPTITDKLYIADKKLGIVKQLPDEKVAEDYLGFDWTADSKSLVYAKRELNDNNQFGKANLYIYHSETGTASKLAGGDIYDFAVPQVSKNGETVYADNNVSDDTGTLSLTAVSTSNGTVRPIASGTVMQYMRSFTTYTYSRIQDLFYVNGVSAATGQPIFIIAKLQTSGAGLQLAPVKVIDDGYTYALLTATKDGMIVSRALTDKTEYGLVKADGSFTKLEITPTANATFGLATTFDLKATASSAPAPADYVYEYVSAPAALRTFLRGLTTTDCATGKFNTVALLAHDEDRQAAVNFTACDSESSVVQYYVKQGDTYKKVHEGVVLIPCPDAKKLKLATPVVPNCTPLQQ